MLNYIKIYYLAKLLKIYLNINIFLVYLLLYLFNYNLIKIFFAILKYYIKKNKILIHRYTRKKI